MDLAKELELLANQFFSGGVAAPAMAVPGGAQPMVPPHVGPNAMNVGAGGASPAVMLPPVPGPVHRPPLAAAPPPKESDLRALPTQLSEQLGAPSPIAAASMRESEIGTPYFLGLAGLPPQASSTPSMPASPSLPIEGLAIPSESSVGTPYFLDIAGAPSLPGVDAHTPPALPTSNDLSREPRAREAREVTPELVPDDAPTRDIFDPNVVKRDFPILRERVHGKRLVWLDNAATTQKPQSVIDRISTYYERENSNVHRGAHTLAARATDAYEAARDKVRRFLGAASPKEIVFVRGATEGINLVAKSWGARNVGRGDEILITWLEHHANIVPWQQLCREKGACLRVAPVDDRGQVILEEFERLLGPKTRIVSFSQVSNALGTIVPAREMIEMAHRHGAVVMVDGAQAVSHMPVDVQALDADFYAFSGHKVFAPTGIGVVWGRQALLDAMPPWQGGGNMITDVTFEKTTYQAAPYRFEAGTGSIGDAVGLGAAIDYVSGLGLENVSRYEHELLTYAEERLAYVPGLRIIGTAPEKAGVISFVLDGMRTEDVGGALDQEGIAVRSGHHCAQPILRRFGLESTVRASLAPYNTREDIDSLEAALRRLQAGHP